MLSIRPRSALRFVFAACAGALITTAAARAEPGITKDTIRIGMFGPLTGPVSMYGYPINNGAIAVYKHINDLGVIHGRKIEIAQEDGACDPVKTRAAVKKLIDNGDVFMVHGGSCSAAAYAARPEFIRAKVPDVFIPLQSSNSASPIVRK